MYPNALPWWLTWIDGRVLLLLTLTIGAWVFYWLSLNDADGNTYDSNDECLACGAHISEPHDIDCSLDQEYNND